TFDDVKRSPPAANRLCLGIFRSSLERAQFHCRPPFSIVFRTAVRCGRPSFRDPRSTGLFAGRTKLLSAERVPLRTYTLYQNIRSSARGSAMQFCHSRSRCSTALASTPVIVLAKQRDAEAPLGKERRQTITEDDEFRTVVGSAEEVHPATREDVAKGGPVPV